MDAWVYVLSKFTQEALLFEALVLFLGFAAYGAYFVTKKRKYGAAQSEVPSNLVKVYLAQLMADAEDLRVQLFGLLGKGSIDAQFLQNLGIQKGTSPLSHQPLSTQGAQLSSAHTQSTVSSSDPALANRLKDVEAKMHEQAKALESVLNEKTRLEQELALAKNNTGTGATSAPAGDASAASRIEQLEAQLAEYAIIEDDLANLKRLQKENKKLREQLESAGASAPSPTPIAAASPQKEVPSPKVTEPVAAPSDSPSPSGVEFEALVDQVESSLEQTIAASPPAASAEETKAPPKTEKELQDEFEKMLNS